MIEIENLQFTYLNSGFHLEIPALEIAQGQRVAVVGPSGSGKTTLLNLISGISVPDSGTIRVGDTRVSELSDAQRRNFRISRIGAVFQRFELVEYLSVRDNILLPYLINTALELNADVYQRATQLAEQVGIADKLGRGVQQLSQGEQQRVAICRALLPAPGLLLADEPTGNLDPVNKMRILELLFQQCSARDLTLVSVTHDAGILDGFDRTVDFEQFFGLENGS